MTFAPIQLKAGVLKNVEEEAIDENLSRLYDGYLDELGYVNRRPGLQFVIDGRLGSAATTVASNGLYWWRKNGYALAVNEGKIYRVDTLVRDLSQGTITLTATEITSSFTLSSNRIYWATDGTRVYLADGTDIYYTDGTTLSRIYDTDTGVPRNIAQIAWLDGYILAITGTDNKFYYSDVNNGLSWSAVDFASAVGSPDNIIALRVRNRDIYLFGNDTIEIWRNDGVNPFTRVSGGFFSGGCSTPDAIQETEDGFYWFDLRRRLVAFDGRGVQQIGLPIDKELSAFDEFSCRSDLLEIEGKSFILFNFMGQNRTIVLEQSLKSWSEWRLCLENSVFERFAGSEIIYCDTWNLFLTGRNTSNRIYCIDPTNIKQQDQIQSDLNRPIKTMVETGHLRMGTQNWKLSRKITISLKRGGILNGTTAGGDTEPKLIMRYMADNRMWSNEKEVGLGLQGETEIEKDIWIRGTFRTRKYQFYVTDNVKVMYGNALQYFDVLGGDR